MMRSTPDISRRGLATGALGGLATAALGIASAPYASATTSTLYSGLYALDRSVRGGLQVSVHDARNGKRWTYNAPMSGECASIVKVLILATVCYRAQLQGRALTAQEKSHAVPMIHVSDNNAASWLWQHVGGGPAVQQVANRLGMNRTVAGKGNYWGLTTTTTADQVLLMDELAYTGGLLTPANRQYILGLMGSVSADQRWGLGSIGVAQNKDGWLPLGDGWHINSIGHVTGGGRNYTAAILQTHLGSMSAGTSVANRVASLLYTTLATPL